MRECRLCPQHVIRCAHFGDMAVRLSDVWAWRDHIPTCSSVWHGPTPNASYIVGGPYSVYPDSESLCDVWRGKADTRLDRPALQGPRHSDRLAEAEAEFARREAMLLAHEVEA